MNPLRNSTDRYKKLNDGLYEAMALQPMLKRLEGEMNSHTQRSLYMTIISWWSIREDRSRLWYCSSCSVLMLR